MIEISGQERSVMFVPIVQEYLEWMIRVSQEIQTATAGFYGLITNKYPSHKMITLLQGQKFEETNHSSETPVKGRTTFTDVGKRSNRAATTWQESGVWTNRVVQGQNDDSLQTLELSAVIWAFQNCPNVSTNIVSDSLYVVGIVKQLKGSMLREVTSKKLYRLLLTLLQLLNNLQQPYFITHIPSHHNIGGLAEGNNRADQLVAPARTGPLVNSSERARLSHEFFHQSATMLKRQFHLTQANVQGIVSSCPACQKVGFALGLGVNPQGLKPLQRWQMDVTHILEFGGLRYVHVTIDTFSVVIWERHKQERLLDM